MGNIFNDFELLDFINLDADQWESAGASGNNYSDAVDDSAAVAVDFAVDIPGVLNEEISVSDSIDGLIDYVSMEATAEDLFAVNQGWPVDLSSTASASDNFEAVLESPKIEEALSVSTSFDAWNPLISIDDNASVSSSFGALNSSTPINDSASVLSSFDVLEANTPFNSNISVSTFFDATDLSAIFDDNVTVSTILKVSNLYSEIVNDSLDLTEDQFSFFVLYENISDNLSLGDTDIIALVTFITDSLFVYDETKIGWGVTAESSLICSDDISIVLKILVNEWLTLVETIQDNWNGQEIVNESITLYDTIIAIRTFSDTLTDTIDITDSSLFQLIVTILDVLGFDDLVSAVKSSVISITESMTLTDNSSLSLPVTATSGLDLVDITDVIAAFVHRVQSDLGLTDTYNLIARLNDSVTDSLSFAETIISKGSYYNVIYDTIGLNISISLNNELWECYVLNTPKFLPSVYSGFDFNSYCIYEDRAFGANATGIFELTGSTDVGSMIHTGVIFSRTDFDLFNQKKFRKGYLDISGISPRIILETDRGQRQVYTVDTAGKVTISSELKSKDWVLSIADFDSLDGLTLIPIILTR